VRHRTAGLTGPPVRAPGRPDSGGRRRTRTTYARRYPIARSVRSVARCCGAVACGGRRGQAEDRRRGTPRPVDSGSGRANGEREPPHVGSPCARALSTRGWLIGRGAASSWRGSGLGGVGALGATPSVKKKKTQFYLLNLDVDEGSIVLPCHHLIRTQRQWPAILWSGAPSTYGRYGRGWHACLPTDVQLRAKRSVRLSYLARTFSSRTYATGIYRPRWGLSFSSF